MKYIPPVVATLLGLLFIMSSVMVLFNLAPMPEIPPESLVGKFMSVFGSTGYMTLIKVLELTGGILVIIPKVRNLGLLILGPIILNMLAFHQFVAQDGIFQPMLLFIAAAALYLLWVERKAFAGLVK